jgi:hypothetical protein
MMRNLVRRVSSAVLVAAMTLGSFGCGSTHHATEVTGSTTAALEIDPSTCTTNLFGCTECWNANTVKKGDSCAAGTQHTDMKTTVCTDTCEIQSCSGPDQEVPFTSTNSTTLYYFTCTAKPGASLGTWQENRVCINSSGEQACDSVSVQCPSMSGSGSGSESGSGSGSGEPYYIGTNQIDSVPPDSLCW